LFDFKNKIYPRAALPFPKGKKGRVVLSPRAKHGACVATLPPYSFGEERVALPLLSSPKE
jgi:hypothetical protein